MPANCPINVSPYDKSGIRKNPSITNLKYTNQDFSSLKTRLVDFINERFGPNGTDYPNSFNDLVEGSLAIMLMEIWAFLADTLSFKIDQIANEVYIDTVTEIENAFRLSKLVGFKPTPPIAARSMWIATIGSVQTTDLRIETPVIIDLPNENESRTIELFQSDSTNSPLFDEDIIIPAGRLYNSNIIGVEGRTKIEEFVATGDPSSTFQLGFFPVIFDSIRVRVDGVTWDQVEYFTDSQPRREYRVEFDSNYNAYLIFGNNRAGLIPSSGSRIRVTYRVGGGVAGNIVTGFIETQRQVFVPGLEFNIPITYKNWSAGEFGYAGDTIEDIRRKLPMYLKTQNRAVTGEDYKTLADQFATPYHGQIGKSLAVLRNYGCSGNIIDLYILAKNGEDGLQEASDDLKTNLTLELDSKKMITDYICIKDGQVVSVDISIDAYMHKFYKKFELEIYERIQRKVNEFFSINNWEYGQILKDTNLVKSLSDIKELENIDVTFITDEGSGDIVTTKFYEIIRPDDVTISFVYS